MSDITTLRLLSRQAWRNPTLASFGHRLSTPELSRLDLERKKATPFRGRFQSSAGLFERSNQYSVSNAVRSVLVNSPVSFARKHEFITELPTLAQVGVPGM